MKAESLIDCPICKDVAKLVEQKIPGYQEPDTFSIYYCSTCNTSFSGSRNYSGNIYETIYKNVDKISGYKRYNDYFIAIKNVINPLHYLADKESMYWGIIETLQKLENNKQSMKMIEVGCGLGYLTYSLIKENYDVIGLDISQTSVDEARKAFGDYYVRGDVAEYAVQHKEGYDVIILTEVIEHIGEPVGFLKILMSMLKEEGIIILTTPNKTIYPKGVVWATDLPPVHYWWFSEESMKCIAGQLNTVVDFIDFSQFYRKRQSTINMRKALYNQQHQSIINKEGAVKCSSSNTRKNVFRKFRLLIGKIFIVKWVYASLMSFNKDIYICKKNGAKLGAIFQKSVRGVSKMAI